jgi:hemolysin III
MARVSECFKDPYCAISHFTGSILALVGMIVLLCLTQETPYHYVGFAIYGVSLVTLYIASGFTHTVFGGKAEDRLERFDYASIFALIAGTYTPICLTSLRGPWGWTLLAIEWTLALIGIVAVIVSKSRPRKLTMTLYLVMGWMVVVAIGPVMERLPGGAVWWLAAGGIVYSLGAVVFAFNRPNLWPGKFNAHDLWHTMVLAGSGCHFMVMLLLMA